MDCWKVHDGNIVDSGQVLGLPHVMRKLAVDPFDCYAFDEHELGREMPLQPRLSAETAV